MNITITEFETDNWDIIIDKLRVNNMTALARAIALHFWEFDLEPLMDFTPDFDIIECLFQEHVTKYDVKIGDTVFTNLDDFDTPDI